MVIPVTPKHGAISIAEHAENIAIYEEIEDFIDRQEELKAHKKEAEVVALSMRRLSKEQSKSWTKMRVAQVERVVKEKDILCTTLNNADSDYAIMDIASAAYAELVLGKRIPFANHDSTLTIVQDSDEENANPTWSESSIEAFRSWIEVVPQLLVCNPFKLAPWMAVAIKHAIPFNNKKHQDCELRAENHEFRGGKYLARGGAIQRSSTKAIEGT
ncbi:MAG: hypothetical protein Q9170_006705 [Blastenia crenularia]